MNLTLTLFFLTMTLYSEKFIEYRVIKGDTLSKVCKHYLSDPKKWRDLLQYNSIASPNLISPETILRIPDILRKPIVIAASRPIAKILFQDTLQSTMLLQEKSIMKIRIDELKSIELKLGTIFVKSSGLQANKSNFNVIPNSAESNLKGEEAEINSDERKVSFASFKGMLDVSAENQTVAVPEVFGTYDLKGSPIITTLKFLEKVKIKPVVNK